MAYQMRMLVLFRATTIVIIIITIAICGESDGRELRPSNHGLEYQESPPQGRKESPEMMTFFAGGERGSSPASDVALPKALNSSDADGSWWTGHRGGGGGGGGGGRGHHVRRVLLVASVACGVTGVALLLASAFVYLVRHKNQQRQQQQSSSTTSSLPPQLLSVNNNGK